MGWQDDAVRKREQEISALKIHSTENCIVKEKLLDFIAHFDKANQQLPELIRLRPLGRDHIGWIHPNNNARLIYIDDFSGRYIVAFEDDVSWHRYSLHIHYDLKFNNYLGHYCIVDESIIWEGSFYAIKIASIETLLKNICTNRPITEGLVKIGSNGFEKYYNASKKGFLSKLFGS